MLWAACCLGFFGFLKAGEFTVNSPFDSASHLSPEDFQVDSRSNPTCMRVQVKCSKTDPFRQGCCIYLGRGRSSICPISAITAYLTLHGGSPGPFFLHMDGSSLTHQTLSSFLQATLSASGFSRTFSGHSFRIGAATSAVQQGIPDHLIKTMGCWSSDAYQLYIRTPMKTVLSVSSHLL